MAKINKSAKDGKIVSKEFAEANPDTTFETDVAPKVKKAKVYVPAIGERFLLGRYRLASEYSDSYLVPGTTNSYVHPVAPHFVENVATIESFEPLAVTIYEVVNGCQTERAWDGISLDECSVSPLAPDEAFRMLA